MLEKAISEVIQVYRKNIADLEFLRKIDSEYNILFKGNHEDNLEKNLADFTRKRKEIFDKIRERTDRLSIIQQQICAKVEISSFQAGRLKPYLNNELFRELSVVTQTLQGQLAKVLEIDQEIIPGLSGQLELIKTELQKIRDAKVGKNAYQNQRAGAARFIDKKK